MSLIKVGVLRGGPSSEYDVSLKTGHSVLTNLPKHYEPVDILVDKNGVWHIAGQPVSPCNIKDKVDVVFNALHGQYGEDGQVQNLLDSVMMPYTGSGHFASAIGMNKVHAKKILADAGLKVAGHFLVHAGDNLEDVAREVFNKYGPPWIVKPVDGGSSVGTYLVKTMQELPTAIESALQYSNHVMIEEFIRGREATCGVVDNLREQKIYSLLPIEIIKPSDKNFFDYDAKYSGATEEICPGRFTDEEKKELATLAARVHEILNLRHYSRTDFIVSPRRGIYILETNTLPGLTEQSLLPKSLSAIGVGYSEFLDHVVRMALENKNQSFF